LKVVGPAAGCVDEVGRVGTPVVVVGFVPGARRGCGRGVVRRRVALERTFEPSERL
jgi:hypothetical protein